MKILSRYISLQFVTNLLLGLTIFTFVLVLDKLFELVNLLINKGVGLDLTLQLLFLLLPATLTLTLPMSNLLAALLTFGQLSETQEITAVRASGISSWHFLNPAIAVAFASTLFLLPFNHYIAPHTHSRFRKLYVKVLQRNPLLQIEPKTFSMIGDYHLYVDRKTPSKPSLHQVTIYKTAPGGPPLRIFSDTGDAEVDSAKGMTLILNHGHIQQIDASNPDRWSNTQFDQYTLFIPFEGKQKTENRAIEEMDSFELLREIRSMNFTALPHPLLQCELQLRSVLATTPLLFVLLAVPLAVRVKRGGRSVGFVLSLAIVGIYYVLLMTGVSMGQRQQLPAIVAVWMGQALLFIAGLVFCRNFLRQ